MSGMKVKRYGYMLFNCTDKRPEGSLCHSFYGTVYELVNTGNLNQRSIRRISPKMHIKKNREVDNG